MKRLVLVPTALGLLVGCAAKVDNLTVNRVVPRYMTNGDLEMACALGETLSNGLAAVPKEDNPPHRALTLGYGTAAMCAELQAMEYELAAARAEHLYEGEAQIAAIKDARYGAERAHGLAARRWWDAFEHTEVQYGPVGDETCPTFNRRHDQMTYLVGLYAGMAALIHDKTAGGPVGVPLDVLPRVARSSQCLDDDLLWHVPEAMRAASWATVPGSGPTDVDPWAMLAEAAKKGEGTGVRLGRAMHVLINANAGRGEQAREGMQMHGESLKSTPVAPDWKFFDEYARRITLHQSDLVWTAAEGYRTPALGDLPQDGAEAPADPFGADPFGADPFGAPEETAEPADSPAEPASEEAPAEETE
ncbi:MAG: hypothetical protein EP330_25185 [Deltaproteobacteria bacterium]|nr:MAG: hypothetical protein EP330_25185 [Deltaproteobacteria bacterium]